MERADRSLADLLKSRPDDQKSQTFWINDVARALLTSPLPREDAKALIAVLNAGLLIPLSLAYPEDLRK